jgi:CBS domain-containing protein
MGQVIAMMRVRDVMTREVVSVQPSTALKEVARLLVERNVSGMPVVDEKGRVVGVVSEGDLLVKELGPEAIHHRRLARLLGDTRDDSVREAKIRAITAGQAMTAPAITIEVDRAITEAAGAMVARGIKRLPVVEGGELVGIVTRADLVRAYVRTDDELASAVRDEVLLRAMWLNPVEFDVTVSKGVVRVMGFVERRSTAEVLTSLLEKLPGVIAVDAQLSWRVDDSQVALPERDPVFPYGVR